MLPGSLFEKGLDIHPIFHQQDANTDVAGDWISLKNYDRAYILFAKGGSEDVDTLGIDIQQATDASGTGTKALNVSKCWYKTGTMTAQGVWTYVSVGSGTPDNILGFGSAAPSGGTVVVADVDVAPLYLLVEILATDLDANGGFTHFTCNVEGDEVNNAVLCSALAILADGAFPRNIPQTPLA